MDIQIKECAIKYAKEKAFVGRLWVNVIGIIVMITMGVSCVITKTGHEPIESTSMMEESLDSIYMSESVQANAGDNEINSDGNKMGSSNNEAGSGINGVDPGSNEAEPGTNEAGSGSNETESGTNEADPGSNETDIENHEANVDSYEESIDGYEENMEDYWDSIENSLRYSDEGEEVDLSKCAGMYTHTKFADITLDINIFSEFAGNEVGNFEISNTRSTYLGVIEIGNQAGKYKMKFEDGDQHALVFYTDGTDYYIYVHNMQYIYGRAESGLFMLTEKPEI